MWQQIYKFTTAVVLFCAQLLFANTNFSKVNLPEFLIPDNSSACRDLPLPVGTPRRQTCCNSRLHPPATETFVRSAGRYEMVTHTSTLQTRWHDTLYYTCIVLVITCRRPSSARQNTVQRTRINLGTNERNHHQQNITYSENTYYTAGTSSTPVCCRRCLAVAPQGAPSSL